MFVSGSRCINRGACLVQVLILLFTSVNAFADSLKVANGSTLTGILDRIAKNQVHLDTGFAGILKIDQNQVLVLRTDEPVYFRMKDGSTVLGIATAGAVSGQLVIKSRNGPIVAQITDIVDAWRRGQEDPAVTEMKNEQEKKRRKWKYSAGFDLSGQKGNSNEFGLAAYLEAKLKGPRDALKIYFNIRNSEREGVRIADETKGGVDYSSDLVDRFGWYTRFELEKDQFEGIDLRSTSAAGLSYKLLSAETQKINFRAGFAYRHESYSTQENIEDPAVDLGLDYDLVFRDWFKLDSRITYVPDYANFSTNYRLGQDTGIEVPLGKGGFWKVRSGISHFFNSVAVVGKEKLDTKYYSRLVFTWGEK